MQPVIALHLPRCARIRLWRSPSSSTFPRH